MIRYCTLLGLLCIYCFQSINAQSFQFYGQILDGETSEPLIGVIIELVGEKMSAQTDDNGRFSIKHEKSDVKVTINYLGYQSLELDLNSKSELLIRMKPLIQLLEVFEITADATKERGLQSLSQVTLEKDILSRNSSAGLGTVLSMIDGVTFISTGTNIQLPVIHGLYGNRILILNNGFKHGFQNWGNDHAPEIDVAGANRIKVVKGAGGVKYGPDALGGAVIIENNELALNQRLYGKLTGTYQTNGRGYGVNGSVGQGFNNWSYHLGGNINQVGDRSAPGYMLTNTGAQDFALQGGVRYSLKNWVFKANYSQVNQTLGILRAAIGSSGPALIRIMEADVPTFIRDFSYDINEPKQTVQHQIISFSTKYFLKNGSNIELKYGKQWNARKEFDVRRNAELPIFDLMLNTDDVQLDWEHSWGANWMGSIGAQYFAQSNVNNPGTNITPFIPNYQTDRISIYALETFQQGRGSWEFGLRYDFETNIISGRDNRQIVFNDRFSFSNLTAGVGHIYHLNDGITLRNNVGTGWRPPNMAELFSFGQHESRTAFGLLRYEPNEEGQITANRIIPIAESNVNPENSIKYTSELDYTIGNHRLTTTAYVNYILNFIYSRPIGVLGTARGPMPTFIVVQSDALFLGTDLTYTFKYGQHSKISGGVSYIWSQNVERKETLIDQPPVHLNARWNHHWTDVYGIDLIELSVGPSYTFRQFQAPRVIPVRALIEGTASLTIDDPIFDFQEAPEGYFLLNAGLQFQKGKFGLNMDIRNALNQRFRDYLNKMRYFADELGINFILSLNYKF
jgi:iron complex outermembrane receptor protein